MIMTKMTEKKRAKDTRTPAESPHFYNQTKWSSQGISSTVCNSVPISSIALSHSILSRESMFLMKMG